MRNRRASKSAADGRLRDARARRVEMQTAKDERELITLEEVVSTHDRMAGLFLESVSGMPARITKDPVERRRLDDLFAMERERLSNRFAEIGDELETGEKVTDRA